MSKLLFNCSLGKIYDDKIVIKRNKYPINEIINFDLYCYLDKRLNMIFFTIGVMGIIGTVFFVRNEFLNAVLIVFFSFSFIMSMLYKERRYYFRVLIRHSKEINIQVKKREKQFAKDFVKEYWKYIRN